MSVISLQNGIFYYSLCSTPESLEQNMSSPKNHLPKAGNLTTKAVNLLQRGNNTRIIIHPQIYTNQPINVGKKNIGVHYHTPSSRRYLVLRLSLESSELMAKYISAQKAQLVKIQSRKIQEFAKLVQMITQPPQKRKQVDPMIFINLYWMTWQLDHLQMTSMTLWLPTMKNNRNGQQHIEPIAYSTVDWQLRKIQVIMLAISTRKMLSRRKQSLKNWEFRPIIQMEFAAKTKILTNVITMQVRQTYFFFSFSTNSNRIDGKMVMISHVQTMKQRETG